MAALHCCVPQCVSDSRRATHNSLSFHRFPMKSQLRKQWLIKIRRDEGSFFKISSKTVVCSRHFEDRDFRYTPNRRSLKATAVPSLFPWSTLKAPRKEPTVRAPQTKRTNYFSSSTPVAPAVSPLRPTTISASSTLLSAPALSSPPCVLPPSSLLSAPTLSSPPCVLPTSSLLSAPALSSPPCVLPPSSLLSAPALLSSPCVLPTPSLLSAPALSSPPCVLPTSSLLSAPALSSSPCVLPTPSLLSAPTCVLPESSFVLPKPMYALSVPSPLLSAPSCITPSPLCVLPKSSLPVCQPVSALPHHVSVSTEPVTVVTSPSSKITAHAPIYSDKPLQYSSMTKENMLEQIDYLKLQLLKSNHQNAFLSQQLHNEKFHLQRFSRDPALIQYYTGFDSNETLFALFEYLKPSAKNMKSTYYECSTTQTMAGRPRNMATIDEFFMFLCRLHAGLQEIDLSVRFNISVATVSRKIITWANFLYVSLGSICIWPTREEVDSMMPVSFRTTYPSTRIIIDCTEIRVQTPSSIHLSSQVYSNYKSTCTFKALIGIAPNGLLTFVSSLYTGCMSDVEITRLSGILDLLEPGDSVMADKGFTIHKDLSKLNVGLNIPPFRYSCGQFSQSQIEETQEIASLRIHVERAIRRIKENKLFDSIIPLSLAGTINQIFAVACMLTNFKGPLIKARV